jgi:hypothetical protein
MCYFFLLPSKLQFESEFINSGSFAIPKKGIQNIGYKHALKLNQELNCNKCIDCHVAYLKAGVV